MSNVNAANANSYHIVEVKNLNVVFGSFFAVKDVSFFVNKGEIFGFLGANGAGKTTTIRVICGLLCATSGEVIVDNEHFIPGKEDIIKSKVGYMSQRFTLYNDLTIKENLAFAAAIHKVPRKTMQKNKSELFELVKIDRDESDLVADLPSGIKQQIALVAALIHNPTLVVLDEPTAGVSPASRAQFWALIKRLTEIGKTVFVTTHYMDEAENCNRIALMRSGELIAVGSGQELKQNTFKQQIYSITPKNELTKEQIRDFSQKCDLFKPYGIHFHVIPKDGQSMGDFETIANVENVTPSLEDVFVQLVEGDR
ncbi:MAG: ABC transporter ATP-binding protein [Holosporales bacterium]|jgi:ABC-2 type transport system ATP-binding protein|nr:ABC transporter ATP-binding protein [Holosporales bacterium]